MLNDNSWQRVPNPIFHEVLLYYLLSYRFRNFAQCLTHPRYFRCFFALAEFVDPDFLNLGTVIPTAPCCVLYATGCQIY